MATGSFITPTGGGAAASTEIVRMFHSSWNFGTLNTWKTWTRGGSVMLTGDSNQTLGTAANPASFVDSNFILVTNRTKLKKVYWSMRHSDVGGQGIELYIKSFTFANGTPRGIETNNKVLIQQSWTTAGSSTNGFKDDFTIAAHTLDPITGIQIAFRLTSGTVTSLFGVNLLLEFE
jgi:hypothetical protein